MTPASIRWPNGLLVALVVAVLAALALWGMHRTHEIGDLPDAQRREVYQSTLANVRTTCAVAAGPTLTDACHEQAELLLEFPECDDACRDLVHRLNHRPTR